MPAERDEFAVLVFEILHEDVVPNLDIFPARTTGAAVGPALGLARVDEHLGVGTARARRSRGAPPVVLTRQTEDALLRDAERLPNLDGLLVAGDEALLPFCSLATENGDVELLRRELQVLRQELEAPRDRLLLEVVVERPVAEHFEEGEVRGVAHRVDVAGADALLDVGEARSRRVLHRAHQIRHERVHARRREKHRRVVLRDDRGAGDDRVPLRLEEGEIRLTKFVCCEVFHRLSSLEIKRPLTRFGSALPFDAFMTCPTRKLKAVFFPAL